MPSFDTKSYREFATGYFLRRDGIQWFWDQYTADADARAEITASPLRAPLEQLSGLPEALIITGEADVLRDEGEAYANRLRKAGVRVTAVRFQGIIHDFVMLNDLAETNAARGVRFYLRMPGCVTNLHLYMLKWHLSRGALLRLIKFVQPMAAIRSADGLHN